MEHTESIEPVAALREITYLMERARADSHRVKAYRRAAQIVEDMPVEERRHHQALDDWTTVPGIGPKSGAVIRQALSGTVPETLQRLRGDVVPLATRGHELWAAVRGDLHVHTEWSDGAAPLDEMVVAAQGLGREYMAVTDHSPRLRVARGLSAERLHRQWEAIGDLNAVLEGFRVLRGSEVDILTDGTLDLSPEVRPGLDVVVASVHSKLQMDSEAMTRRMVAAIADPRTNVLGHCTGRLLGGERGTRGESVFDAEVVFAACAQFGVALEINGRPERLDPPERLLNLAVEMGCVFALDSDAHAPGQLEFARHACERAEDAGIDADRVVNTWPLEKLLSWARGGAL